MSEHRRRIDKVLDPGFLVDLPEWPPDELQSTLRELGQLEQQVSQQRRELHQVIDRMEADLTARHRWARRDLGPRMTPDLESRLRDLGEFIRDQRRTARLSLRKLSELAGISNPYLSQIERGLRKPSAEILQAIARALRISSETLYVRAGFLEERETDEDLVVGDILRDRTITEGQKQALVEIYRSFQREQAEEEEEEEEDRSPQADSG